MSNKILKTRIIQKHDTEANWKLVTNFTPLNGEIIIYDEDENYNYKRIKIGNGTDNVNNLDFVVNKDEILLKTEQELTDEEVNQIHKNLKLENLPTEEQVEKLYKTLSSDRTLRFYCIEDVVINLNGVPTTYPANSNVEVKLVEDDVFEIIPTSDNSILALNGFPGALGTYYSWLEGVKQFSNILFDMNDVEMYSKWSQGNQGSYQVQYAQYTNCIFWSDNAYVSDVSKRTNYTLYYTSQLPLCYSSIPDNTFKAFYLAFNVNSDPNWGNKAYRDSFAQATWATQVFSYYGARTIGIFGHDDPDFNITLPKDCRGLMYAATAIENAGTFDAVNTTNFGAKSGSWREAFGFCSSLKRLYIKNLKVNLNISWSPIDYDSISYIISAAANTNAITISVSSYTYNLLSQADFDLATSKNITIALLTTNYVEDKRLSEIANKADKTYVDTAVAAIANNNTTYELSQNGNIIILDGSDGEATAVQTIGRNVEGESFMDSNGNNYTGGVGAEVFNYYNTSTLTYAGEPDDGGGSGNSGNTTETLFLSNIASGNYSHAEGLQTIASGVSSHAEGDGTIASGNYSHAEGEYTEASWYGAHAEGTSSKASGYGSHAEGQYTKASGNSSHAEGQNTTASGYWSHAEGKSTTASGDGSHVEGNETKASGHYSHAEGTGTVATRTSQHVQGEYNIKDTAGGTATRGQYVHIVGNGTADDARSNAHTLDWDGNACFAGNVYVGSADKTTGKELATKEYVDTILGDIEALLAAI